MEFHGLHCGATKKTVRLRATPAALRARAAEAAPAEKQNARSRRSTQQPPPPRVISPSLGQQHGRRKRASEGSGFTLLCQRSAAGQLLRAGAVRRSWGRVKKGRYALCAAQQIHTRDRGESPQQEGGQRGAGKRDRGARVKGGGGCQKTEYTAAVCADRGEGEQKRSQKVSAPS